MIDADSGELVKQLSFAQMPERMTISADNNTLYVALLVHEHDSYRDKVDQSGFIAVIDLVEQIPTNTFAINIDPYDLVVTSGGKLIVSSGSGLWTRILAYDVASGAVLGEDFIRQGSRLSLHPSEEWVFAVTDLSPSDIRKFDVRGEGIISAGYSPYHSDHRISGNVWATPDGNYLLTRGGDLFNTSDMAFVRSVTAPGISIESVSFDDNQHAALLVLSSNDVQLINLNSFESIETISLSGVVHGVSMGGQNAYYLLESSGTTRIVKEAHPCLGCNANTAPVAAFGYTPISGNANDTYEFDASASSDAEDESGLQYRWDIDNDDVWETAFSVNSYYSHNFPLSGGTYHIRLQVKDSGGLVHSSVQSIIVAHGINTGVTVTDSIANQLAFTITDIQQDATRSLAYISDKSARRLYVVDLQTGLTLKYFEFDQMPERMTLSTDGNTLYLALLVDPWSEEGRAGFIAVFDLVEQAHVNTFAIGGNPYDLVVTSAGKLMVSSYYSIYAYDAESGVLLGESYIRHDSRLALHPNENWVFSDSIYSMLIGKYDISGVGVSLYGESSFPRGHDVNGNVWATPDGDYVITGAGDLFNIVDMSYVMSLSTDGVNFEQLLFDSEQQVMFALASDGKAYYYNTSSFELIGTVNGISDADWILQVEEQLYFTSLSGLSSQLTHIAHPCLSCGDNTAPTAAFSYTPASGDTSDTFVFDASSSFDAEDIDTLQYRWDINNDGEWDTGYSASSSHNHDFLLSGTHYIRLQVKDSAGLVNSVMHAVDVAEGIDAGILVTDSIANQLQFSITDATVDKLRSVGYFTDKSAKRLYVVDLTAGLTVKYFEFDFMPERMSVSPDGSFLYVALLVQEHSSYWWNEDQSGYIAIVDLEQQAHVNTLSINTDPYDLVVTSGGKLIVSSGSGQWTDIVAYDADSGVELGRVGIRQSSRLTLHPDENWVFAADTDLSPSDIEKFDISGVGISSLGDSPYHGDHRMGGNVWVTPDGNYLITRGGDLFSSFDMSYIASLTDVGVNIEDLSFEASEQSVVLIGSDNVLYRYDLTTFTEMASNNQISTPQFILKTNNEMYIVSWQATGINLLLKGDVFNLAGDTLITFDPAPLANGSHSEELYLESGLLFTGSLTASFAHSDAGLENRPYSETAYLVTMRYYTQFQMEDGSSFDVIRIDLAEYSILFEEPKEVTFTCHGMDGSTTPVTFTTDGILGGAGISGFETFTFPDGCRDLDYVEINSATFSMDSLWINTTP